jgi:hypothetical protein
MMARVRGVMAFSNSSIGGSAKPVLMSLGMVLIVASQSLEKVF